MSAEYQVEHQKGTVGLVFALFFSVITQVC